MATLTVQHQYYPGTQGGKPYDLVCFRIEFPDADRPGIVTKPGPSGLPQQNADIREIKLTYRQLRAKRAGEPPDPQQTDELVWGFYGTNLDTKMMAVAARQRYMKGKLVLSLKWGDTAGAEKSWKGEFASGNQLNSTQHIKLRSAAPRLSDLLGGPQLPLEAWPPSSDALDPSTAAAEMIAQVLKYIHDGLAVGLTRFWQFHGDDACRGTQPLRDTLDSEIDKLSPSELEECWAQHITELMVGTCYGGPGSAMGSPPPPAKPKDPPDSHKQDGWVLQQFARSNDPVHSLLFACQQANSMLIISRGFASLANNPLDADGYTNGDLPGKTILDGTSRNKALFDEIVTGSDKVIQIKIATHRWLPGESEGKNAPILRPGTSFWVDKTRPAFVHCGGALRAWKSDVAQLMDTGTWIWDDPLVASTGYLRDTVAGGTLPKDKVGCKAIVVPPEATQDQLRAAIRKMRESRPLGVLRLVVSRKPTYAGQPLARGDIYWASPLLAMNEEGSGGTPRQSYSISRLLAALRGIPHRKHFEVGVYIWIPNGIASCNAAVAPDARTQKWWKESVSGPLRNLKELARISVGEDGLPRLREHLGSTTPSHWPDFAVFDSEPFGTYAGAQSQGFSSVPDMQSTSTQVPDYFKGLTSTEPTVP